MKRILIIGGTGMLKNTSTHFISKDDDVTIIARNKKKLDYFANQFPNNRHLHLISQDYFDTANFISSLEENIKTYGNFDLVMMWMHSGSENSLLRLIELTKNAVHYHIKGSSYYNPEKNNSPDVYVNNYHEIFLGFKVENEKSRWLTNEEISCGVIEAVEKENKRTVIGQIEPWEIHP